MRYHLTSHVVPTRRKGVVLLVVMAMLALFAALGISCVLYADAVATASQGHRDSLSKDQADIDTEVLSAYFLSQLVYGTDNKHSSMQGHSFAETMYGYNPGSTLSPASLSYAPYTGPGRQLYTHAPPIGLNNQEMVQYTQFSADASTFIRRPGFHGTTTATHRYIEGTNVPWTAPDRNTMALSVMSAKGEVLLPSFFRSWTNVDPTITAGNSMERYKTLRPHVSWHSQFNPPDTEVIPGTNIRLDVRNNDFGPGFRDPGTGVMYNNDSIWMDLGFPIMTAPNGKRFRPLFSPMVVDLSNRLHMWLHGNNMGAGGAHVSNRGHGPSEVNLQAIPGINAGELGTLFNMRYGGATAVGAVSGFRAGPWYAPEDADGLNATTSTAPLVLPAAGSFSAFPTFPAGHDNATAAETTNKPLAFDINNPPAPKLAMSHLEALLRLRGTNGPATTSELTRRMPLTFSDLGYRNRNMVTLASWHLDRIGTQPFVYVDPNAGVYYPFDDVARRGTSTLTGVTPPMPKPDYSAMTWTPPANGSSEYGVNDWRSVLGARMRVNLNRSLSPYPQLVGGVITDGSGYAQALADRQGMAKEIYNAFIRVTGAQDPNNPLPMPPGPATDPTSAQYKAARWLAQISVNIVDYIDEDDYATPFNWDTVTTPTPDPVPWVFGTELPRLLMNETYAQHEPGPNDNKQNIWVELHNPFNSVPGASYPRESGIATLQITQGPNPPYKIEIYKAAPALAALTDPANTTGSVPRGGGAFIAEVTDWGNSPTTQKVMPSSGAYGNVPLPQNIAPAPNGAVKAGNIVTITTMAAHGLTPADVDRAVRIMDVGAGYDGLFKVTQVTPPNTFQYVVQGAGNLLPSGGGTATFGGNAGFFVVGPEGTRFNSAARNPNLPATFVTPDMSINGAGMLVSKMIHGPNQNGATQVGTLVTIKTQGNHMLNTGDLVTISNVDDPGYNGTFTIVRLDNQHFTYNTTAGLQSPSGNGTATVGGTSQDVTLLLRRLANPHIAHDNNPGPRYNPYITVDFVTPSVKPANGSVNSFEALGKRQPYSSKVIEQAPTPLPPQQPKHTFFRHNGRENANPVAAANQTLDMPFDWLVHLDRPLVNHLELLHVSSVRPHELTQKFITGPAATDKFKHYAPWDDQNTLLYRALDVFGTPNKLAGTMPGGRWPGLINLNTLTEEEIFQALCDANGGQFTALEVSAIFQNMLAARNPAATVPTIPQILQPTSDGAPFKTFGASIITDTWGRLNTAGAQAGKPVFELTTPGLTHPYQKAALLQKIYNNITNTSNVFAVTWTVGFFEVVDETVRPARLGQEIGRSENRHIRHRFFAIVDRSALQMFNISSTTNSVPAGADQTMNFGWNSAIAYSVGNTIFYNGLFYRCIQGYAANGTIVPTNTTFWTPVQMNFGMPTWNNTQAYAVSSAVFYNGATYVCTQANTNTVPTNTAFWMPQIQPGMLLEIDAGLFNAEVVAVKTVNATTNSFTADFKQTHAAGASIICRGNPGPQMFYNPRRDSNVILHMNVIK